MTKCDCYEERTERHYFTEFERGFNAALGRKGDYRDRTYGVCLGTRECDRCTCGGNRSKCDFYPENRTK